MKSPGSRNLPWADLIAVYAMTPAPTPAVME